MKNILSVFTLLVMTTLMIWCTGLLWFGTSAVTVEQSTANIQQADAIIVLTGGIGRIDEGFYLFATHRAPKLFISGVNQDVSIETLKNSWEGIPLPNCCIEIGHEAENTWGNAIESAQWIKDNNISSVFLVTSEYHMPRAHMEFSFTTPETRIYPHPVYRDRKQHSTISFVRTLIIEYHKTIITYLRHVFAPPAT